MAVLVRAGFQTREFEERLMTMGLPYRVVGGPRFYERQEIRDALAYFRVVAQSGDDLAFERIVNVPKRGLGKASLQTVHLLARRDRLPLTEAAARLVETDELRPAARRALAALIADFERWRGHLATESHVELAKIILDESGYTAMWKDSRAPDAPGRLENLKELVAALGEFDSLPGFLEHVSLVMEVDEAAGEDKVTLMTLHGAKGLEFDTVFLPGWEEGLFPHQRALDEGGLAALEEERRLAYVGLTRARRRAFISFAANRRVYGHWQSTLPSRFVDELPPDTVQRVEAPGLFAGGSAATGGFSDAAAPFAGPSWGFRSHRAAPSIDGIPYQTSSRNSAGGTFDAGQRVFHQKFGYGRVLRVDGDKLEIAFEKAGTKKVIDSFVEAV